jgi:acyl-CoA synthetase (NDP forming)
MSNESAMPRTTPYAYEQLRPLVRPQSLAIIGASETPGSFGATTLANLRAGFEGRVYAVNPKRDTIFGERCYHSVADLPEAVDLAVVIVPAAGVEPTLLACAERGIGSAVIYSSGFAELGTPEAIEAQKRIERVAREKGIRVVGPNCIGLATVDLKLGVTFMPSMRDLPMKQGPVGIVTQSGALGYMILQAMRRGVGFSHWLTTGNACDVDVSDFVNYLVDDEHTKAIACSFEGLSSPDRFLAAARRALAAGKPLVVLKVGQTEASREAALSHTGSLVGSSAAYTAALESVGAVLVDDFETLVETAGFLSKAGTPKADGTAVVTMSGGAGIMSLDLASVTGVSMPKPAPETQQRIAAIIPAFGSATNPADLTGESIRFPEMYANTLHAFAADPAYGNIIVVMASGGYGQLAVDRARMIEQAAREAGKPVAVVWMNEWLEGPGSEIYDGSEVLTSFRSLRRCLATIAAWNNYHARRAILVRRNASAAALRTVAPSRPIEARGALTEGQSKKLLAAFNVPVTREVLAATVDEAVAAADRIGYPVVLKAESPDILHKSDAGVVKLKIGDADAVRRAWHEIEAAIAKVDPAPRIEGIVVQEMVGSGIEVIVGTRFDDQFGPLVSCGLGGVAVEVMRDVAVALAPVDAEQAMEMIRSLRSYRLLTGFRGAPAVDVAGFADIVARVSEFAWAHGETVPETDVNPVILRPDGAKAVDALVITRAVGPAAGLSHNPKGHSTSAPTMEEA